MNQRFNLKDPRIKHYLDSLDPKYRKMLEDIDREQQPGMKIERPLFQRGYHEPQRNIFC